jgi:pumilio RNA-binding family
MPHSFTLHGGAQQPLQQQLQLSQLLPSVTGTTKPSEFLVTTLEVRVTSLCREFSVNQSIDECKMDAFDRAAALVPQVPPLALVQGIVLPLALHEKGCRLLQLALEKTDNATRRDLIAELRGHVREALDSPHANHVLQRVIELVPPSTVQFILDELASSWDMSSVVQHRFGCRLLERIFEHFTACGNTRLTLDFFLANGAFGDLAAHCFHMFGTHVMQHLMEYGTYEQQLLVCSALRNDLRNAALHEFAVGVLDKALTYLPQTDQQALAQEILQHEGLLPRMAMCWRGQPATERVLRVVEDAAMADVLKQICSNQQALKRSKGGRTLLTMANKKDQ